MLQGKDNGKGKRKMSNHQLPFDEAAARLPGFMRELLACVPEAVRGRATELRMRAGGALCVTLPEGPMYLCNGRVTPLYQDNCATLTGAHMSQILRALCDYSVHSFTQDIAQGFITLPGGHRAGISGTAVLGVRDQESGARGDGGCGVVAVRDVSSINLRIARQVPGAAAELCGRLYTGDALPNVLVAGPPGSGKTTILRDLALRLSSGLCGPYRRVAIVDERGELAGAREGAPCRDVGPNTDVLTGYPKGEGILLAIRSLSPEIMICDELGGEGDAAAIEAGLGAGVRFAASAHAGSAQEAVERPVVRRLLGCGAFDYIVMLEGLPGSREQESGIRIFTAGAFRGQESGIRVQDFYGGSV